jgi:carbamoyltransferase
MRVIGISAYYHDSAAALVEDGEVVAAAQLERFTRKKHDDSFPGAAVAYCLDEARVTLDDIDYVGFYDKPLLTFDRLLETYVSFAPRGLPSFVKAIPIWVKQKVLLMDGIRKGLAALDRGTLKKDRLLFGFHHHSHAASAFYPSPFEEAAILVMDGVGEWATTTLGAGSGNELELKQEIRFPHSLGMLYSAFTYYLGFKVNDGEYKMMGLAPYGEPRFQQLILEHLIDLKEDGSFRMDMSYFNYCTGLTMTNRRFDQLFGDPPRKKGDPLTQKHMDIAASAQAVTKEIVMRLCEGLYNETGQKNLCMAGGVALNCVINGQLLREGPFERIWVQPAAGDAGGAVGIAQAIAHTVGGVSRRVDPNVRDGMRGSYLGPHFDEEEIRSSLDWYGAVYRRHPDDELFAIAARVLAEEKVVGWFQGRMEFGPRALGNRSILGDPRSTSMQRVLNLKIKYRESFRPFAPAVLREDVGLYFELASESPYMLLVAPVRKERHRLLSQEEKSLEGLGKLHAVRSDVPAITHVDHSARIQTVHRDTNPRFYRLIETFKSLTGYGILVNTSFNVADEPIVCTPEDAYKCFMGTEMDMLVLGNIVLRKEEQ